MEIIGSRTIWSFDERGRSVSRSGSAIRKAEAPLVASYMDLATRVAELQFRNRDLVLMFRGQRADHRNRLGYSSIKPSLLRGEAPRRLPSDAVLDRRFARLVAAEKALVAGYEAAGLLGRERLKRQRILRWAILQHYEICPTPLLDVTQSLRIAASFASDGASHGEGEEAFVFVLGIPNVSGAITASAEAGLQVLRLASVCPPSAARPHLQEGYLLGEYPDCASAEQKMLYEHAEMDFGRRLIAKFRFEPAAFWQASPDFPQVGREALYPREDAMLALAERVRAAI
ncbi:FRG domain-containing protein [Acetobacteraceae bacterium H6797]|nr:FRG domain-containing protein [Acetobacteraceae bacterium H6797]